MNIVIKRYVNLQTLLTKKNNGKQVAAKIYAKIKFAACPTTR